MSAWLLVIGLLAALVGLAWIAGRQGANKAALDANAKTKDRQLKAAADRPVDRDDLTRRMRDDKW